MTQYNTRYVTIQMSQFTNMYSYALSKNKKNQPFYIATSTIPLPAANDTWFERGPVGVNKLSSMMKRMVVRAGMNPDKRLSNHSARKFLVQKLNDCSIPPNEIIQISGHKNLASINNYSHINQNQHRDISQILHSNSTENCPQNPPNFRHIQQ